MNSENLVAFLKSLQKSGVINSILHVIAGRPGPLINVFWGSK